MLSEVLVRMLICLIVCLAFYEAYPFRPRVIFLDVGQGDSALILPEKDYQILIDGGPGSQLFESLGRYIPVWDRKIELVVLTHPHADHMNGLVEFAQRYEIERLLYNPVCNFSLPPNLDKGVIVRGLSDGPGREGAWVLNILNPSFNSMDSDSCDASPNINNASVVLRFDYEQKSFLFMGDAEKELESKLLNNPLILNIDYLKAGHHCSKTSTSEKFLDLVNPEFAICSVGEGNMYGHPSPETIQKFQDRGIKYLLTSKEGDIIVNL